MRMGMLAKYTVVSYVPRTCDELTHRLRQVAIGCVVRRSSRWSECSELETMSIYQGGVGASILVVSDGIKED